VIIKDKADFLQILFHNITFHYLLLKLV